MADITDTGINHGDLVTLLTNIKTLVNELRTDHATVKTWLDEVDGDLDKINNYLHYMNERDGVIAGDHTFTAGGNVTLTGAGTVTYRINGQTYTNKVSTAIALEDNGDVTQNKWGAWRILIDAAGTVTTQDPAGSGSQAFDSAEDALLSLAQRAITANTVEIGYLTLVDSDSAINLGTDDLNAAGVTAAMYVVTGPRLGCGLNAALGGSGFAADTGVATFDTGTIDAMIQGGVSTGVVFSRDLGQISAITNQAMNDADTIATTKYGGWLMVTNLAGTGVYALAANGIAGAVSAMTYATSALTTTALDEVQNRLPAIFAPLARVELFNTTGGNDWVAATDNWDHDTAVATVINYTFGVLDRTSLIGDVGKNAPVIQSTVTAPVISTISESALSLTGL